MWNCSFYVLSNAEKSDDGVFKSLSHSLVHALPTDFTLAIRKSDVLLLIFPPSTWQSHLENFSPLVVCGGRRDQVLLWAGTKSLGCFCGAIHLLPWWWHSPMHRAPHSQELLVPGDVPSLGIPHLLGATAFGGGLGCPDHLRQESGP